MELKAFSLVIKVSKFKLCLMDNCEQFVELMLRYPICCIVVWSKIVRKWQGGEGGGGYNMQIIASKSSSCTLKMKDF